MDVLCVDKTGTITQPEMSVREVVALDEDRCPGTRVEEILNAYYQAIDADNDTARAMAQRFHKSSIWQVERTVPFTSANKWSAVVFRGYGSYVVGAPEFIMKARYADLEHMVTPYQEQGCRVLLLAKCANAPTMEGASPVMATVWPAFCSAFTSLRFWSGVTRPNTVYSRTARARRVINNIQRAAALYLVKNIMSLFLSLINLVAGFPYPGREI